MDHREGGGWPTPAKLGNGPGAPVQADPPVAGAASPAADSPQAPAAGGLDAAALRAGWDQVLAAVKSRKRTAHAQLADAQVAAVTGRTLVLAFQHAPILRQFLAGTGPDVLREALQESLGADLELSCVLHDGLHAAASAGARPSGGPAAGRAASAPAYDDFAPGDEAVPDDPDAPPPAQEQRGEEAALKLVQDQLGGKVVSTTGDQAPR